MTLTIERQNINFMILCCALNGFNGVAVRWLGRSFFKISSIHSFIFSSSVSIISAYASVKFEQQRRPTNFTAFRDGFALGIAVAYVGSKLAECLFLTQPSVTILEGLVLAVSSVALSLIEALILENMRIAY